MAQNRRSAGTMSTEHMIVRKPRRDDDSFCNLFVLRELPVSSVLMFAGLPDKIE